MLLPPHARLPRVIALAVYIHRGATPTAAAALCLRGAGGGGTTPRRANTPSASRPEPRSHVPPLAGFGCRRWQRVHTAESLAVSMTAEQREVLKRSLLARWNNCEHTSPSRHLLFESAGVWQNGSHQWHDKVVEKLYIYCIYLQINE